MQLEFTITNQTLKRTDTQKVVENSAGYLTAHFDLPSEYSGVVAAYFRVTHNGTTTDAPPVSLDSNNICTVPSSIIKSGILRVSITCTNTNLFVPTNSEIISILPSGAPSSFVTNANETNQYAGFQGMYQEVSDWHGDVVANSAQAKVSEENAEVSEAYSYNSELNSKASESTVKGIADSLSGTVTNAVNATNAAIEAKQGALDAASTAQSTAENLESTYAPRLATAESQSTTAILKANAMTSGSPKGVYSTLSALKTAFPTGTSGAYLVTADGKWYYWDSTLATPDWTAGGVYQSTGIADKSVTFSMLEDSLPSIFAYDTTKIGKDLGAPNSNNVVAAPSGSMFLNIKSKATKSGYIKNINLYAKNTGTLIFYIGSLISGVFTKRIQIDATITQTGLNTIPVTDTIINAGEYMGVYASSGNVLGYYSSSAFYKSDDYYVSKTTTASFSTITCSAQSLAWLLYNYDLDAITNIGAKFEQIGNEIYGLSEITNSLSSSLCKDIAIMEEINDFSTVSDWSNTGFATTNTLVGSSGAIYKNQKLYGIDSRTIRVEMTIDSSGVIEVGSIPNEATLPYVGSSIRLDSTDNTIKFMGYSTSSSRSSTVIKSYSLGFILTGFKIFIEIEKNGRTLNFRVGQIDGTGYYETSYINSVLNGTSGTNYYTIGTLQGYPYLSVISGSATFTYFSHYTNCKKDCLLYVIGDSITEGYGVEDTKKWSRLLQNTFGSNEVCISGIGGSVASEGLDRIKSELININPKNVIYFMGTNSFSSRDIMTQTFDYLNSKGCRTFQCSLSKFEWSDQSTWMYASNTIRLEAVMRSGGAIIASYFQADLTHPNADGCQVIYNKIMRDANAKLKRN